MPRLPRTTSLIRFKGSRSERASSTCVRFRGRRNSSRKMVPGWAVRRNLGNMFSSLNSLRYHRYPVASVVVGAINVEAIAIRKTENEERAGPQASLTRSTYLACAEPFPIHFSAAAGRLSVNAVINISGRVVPKARNHGYTRLPGNRGIINSCETFR